MGALDRARRTSSLAVCAALAVALLGAVMPAGVARADEVAPAAEVAPATTYSVDVLPELSSPVAFLVETGTQTVLLNKDADARRDPASTTKVMTALLVIENLDLDAQVSVEEGDFAEVTADSSVAGLVAGETLSVRDLLACLLLPSGNDASYVLARAVAGDWQSFVGMMNERAAELGCAGTHFANPCGLPDDNHYTTARDLATILQAALAYPEFVEIAGSATWDLPATSGNPARTLENTNQLINPESPVYMDGVVTAGKTGFTYDAGRCLVVGAEKDGMRVVGVVLGAGDEVDEQGVAASFTDMRALLDWGFGAWQTGSLVVEGDVIASADVSLSENGEAVDARSTGEIVATVPRGTTLQDLTVTPTWQGAEGEDGSFQAPIEEGDALGTAGIALGDREFGEVGLVAARAMELSIPAFVLWWLSDPVHLGIVIGSVVAVVAIVALIVGLAARRRRRRMRHRGKHSRA